MLNDRNTVSVAASSLPALSQRVATPAYDRSNLRRSVVHFGVGGFHRAHLATYINDLANGGDRDWSIVGAGVMESDARMADVLEAQDHLYALVSRGANETDVTIIGSIVDFILAIDDSRDLVDAIADADTQIVSMTITEGGYPVDDHTGEFLPDQSLATGAFAVIAQGLEQRRTNGGGPLTVMSCDNIMTNGQVARTAMLGEAARHSSELVEWIERNVRFPNSMVDRITPATTASDIEWLETTHGIVDGWPVVAEPFRQWVVEDDFGGDRLPLEKIDVIITDNIDPYELTKLRLLNAGHSCLAYLAALDGFTRVDEAMADPVLCEFVTRLLHIEAKPTLPAAAGINLDEYIGSLIERFSNPGVGDQISRLCLDGTAKFPKFLLPTVRSQLDGDGTIARSALALAGWCEYLRVTPAPSSDPKLDAAIEHANRSLEDPASFLDFGDVFGSDLAASSMMREQFAQALTSLRSDGVQSAVAAAT